MTRTHLLPMLASALASLSLASAGADMFILSQIPTIVMARMDPIVNPGALSSHVHNIAGASNFGLDLPSPNDQLKAACSSAVVGDDKSNYWSPALYWQFPNGTYQPLVGNNRIYYFMKGTKVKPFPPGFRMISGTAMARNATDYKSLGVRISCNHGDGKSELPTQGCRAISMGIFFPSCGLADGSISSDDNFSHMAWPLGYKGSTPFNDVNGEWCPESHPIKYPTIFYEANYYPVGGQEWVPGTRYVLSNGDAWGPSYHADFHNGWKPETLSETIKQCGGYGRGPGDNQAACAPLRASLNKAATIECRLEGKIPNEDVGFYRPIKNLPGCNPLWEKGTDKKPGCAQKAADPPMVYPNVYYRGLEFNSHIPMAFIDAPADTNFSDISGIKYGFTPSLGTQRKSYLVPWGSDGTNMKDLKSSTINELVAAGAGGNANPAKASSSSSSDKPAATSSKVNLSGVIGAKPSSSTSKASSSSNTKPSSSSEAAQPSSSKAPAATTSKNSLSGFKDSANADANANVNANVPAQSSSSSTGAKATSAVASKANGTAAAIPGGGLVLAAGEFNKCKPKMKKRNVPRDPIADHLRRRARRSALGH